ncbi:MAG: REP-associated tyrosine transposase [Verrucomicrobiota bacterium]|jgi:REP element-mobilizing transposase RayT
MPRPLRIEYAGAIYHVLSRGDRREAIFLSDGDRELFLETLGQVCGRSGWQVHAWCLMNNHFHLVVETPRANLAAGMKWFLGTYTQRFNRRHHLSGHLFQGRYKAQVIDGESRGYLRAACDYVHLNPERAKLIRKGATLTSWRWSSYPQYLGSRRRRPAWLRTDRLLGEHGIEKEDTRGRGEFARRMEGRRLEAPEQALAALRRGWRVGAEDFVDRLVRRVKRPARSGHGRRVHEETENAVGRRIVEEELRRRDWKTAELERRAKGDQGKVEIAQRLRAETTLTLREIADLLQMGAPTHVAHLLYRYSQ